MRIFSAIAAASLTLFSGAALAADPPTSSAQLIETPCIDAAPCRHVLSYGVPLPDGRVGIVKPDKDLDYVTDNTVIILPGEWVVARLDSTGAKPLLRFDSAGLLADLPPGDPPAPPSDGFRLSFREDGKPGAVLTLQNGFSTLVDYRARMSLPGRADLPTSVCTLFAKASGFESWSDPILSLKLSDFNPLPANGKPGCK